MFNHRWLIVLTIVLTLILGLFGGVNIVAVNGSQVDIEVDNSGGQQKITSLKELEALYPMSPEAEAAIVHDIPACPVIIDGVSYEPEDVTLFNGQRLRFSVGKDKNLYAFTTVEGLEEFLQDQFGHSDSK